jgi:hypothetical protein
MRVAILAVALALSANAGAHDLDCHGIPVPRAEKLGCCGAGDGHFGSTSQFYEDHDGFWHYLVAGQDFLLVRGAPESMTKIQPLPSAEGCYTVWFRVWSDSSGIFVPGEIRPGMSPDEVRFYCLEIPMAM